jgi:membrane-associated protease RseP (regulator of RpoE activity)
MFALTVGSVFLVGEGMAIGAGIVSESEANLLSGWRFGVPFLLILLFHEFGHWIAAKLHRVPASLPYFIPMPFVLFGTFGAVITMPERIRSRNALLDIGAAGPLAGLVVAIPTMVVGLLLSEVRPMTPPGSGSDIMLEGQSILYWALKRIALGPMPDGHDVFLHPTAFAAWSGLFVTMINLLPWGQLDGGHIAYAWLGERHHRIAHWVRNSLLLLFAYNVTTFVLPVWRGASAMGYSEAIGNSLFWLFWFVITGAMARFSGGAEHPPCEPGTLTPTRRRVAILCLILFVGLFMPTPLTVL